jgi:hypothetical protein
VVRQLLQCRSRGQREDLVGPGRERHVLDAPVLHVAVAEVEALQRIDAHDPRERHPQAADHGIVVRADRACHALAGREAVLADAHALRRHVREQGLGDHGLHPAVAHRRARA